MTCWAWGRSAALVTVVFLGASCAGVQYPAATRVNVSLALQPDGSLLVQETLEINATTPLSSFRRVSPGLHHDGISDVQATLDGASVPQGVGATRVEVAGRDRLDVTWHFPAMQNSHVLGLSYRAANVVWVSGIRGRVNWQAMPPDRGFDIGAMTVALALPRNVIQLDDPWVMEAGWDVAREQLGMRAQRQNVAAGESVTVGIEFTIDTLSLAQPAWQFHALRAHEFRIAFLSGGLFLLIVAAGIVVMIELRLKGIEPGAAFESERRVIVRGLRVSGVVTLIAGAIGWFLVRMTLSTYGPSPYALPACTLISGLLFLIAAQRLTRRATSG